MLTFTPLLGAQSSSAASQSLLELDGGVQVLIDVGWDERFNAANLQALEQHASSLSLILLTHATIDHIGAYAHCCKHIPAFSQVPVYATTPVITLGRTLLADLYASTPLAAAVIPLNTAEPAETSPATPPSDSTPSILYQPPTPEEIATYFARIHPLKYSQPHLPVPSPFSPPLGNLSITAYGAGHTPGGTIWHIQHGVESIVYAADWNLARENLLAGAAFLGGAGGGEEIIEPLQRPTALICSSKGVERTDILSRKKRDETLVSLIRETIAQGGKVLIPTDSSARVLELAFILNHTWRENIDGPHADTFKHARIYMASRTSTSTVRQLQSMLEWMDETIVRDAEAAMSRDLGEQKLLTLLDWRFVKQIERKSQFDRALRRSAPCILLASDASLEWGFSRHALESMAADPRNLVILTEYSTTVDPTRPSIAKQLADCWRERSDQAAGRTGAKVVNADGQSIQLFDAAISPLGEDEDLQYQQYVTRTRQMHSSLQGDNTATDTAAAEIADDQASESSDSEDEDEDPEHQGKALNISVHMTQTNKRKIGVSDAELGINVLIRSKNVHDFTVVHKRGRDKVFPFVTAKHKDDDYGDVIKPEEYLRAEERDDVDGVDLRNGTNPQTTGVGQKRKWDDASVSAGSKARNQTKDSPAKRTKLDREPDDIDALIARATGSNGRANGADPDNSDAESDYEPDEATVEGPQKVMFQSRELTLQLRIAHVDFSGLHERRDLLMLIPLIRPRKLILIAGTESETQSLAEECRQLLGGGETSADVFTPITGEGVDASVDTNAWTLRLSRLLVKKLTWQNVKGLGVVALTGRLAAEPEETVKDVTVEENAKKKLKLIKGEEEDAKDDVEEKDEKAAMPVLDLVNAAGVSSAGLSHQRATQPVHVGDLRFADLRQLLKNSGHTAELRGEGTLLVDSTVVVRKSATGIEVEAGAGGLSQPTYRTRENEGSFYAVRKLIYGGLAVVAGVS